MVSTTFVFAGVTVLLVSACATRAQESETRQIVVRAEADELPSAYGAPPDLSHGRISTLTKSYVLTPFSFEVETGYQGDIFRQGGPLQLFWQEMGVPGRLTVGLQNEFAHVGGERRGTDRSASCPMTNCATIPI